MTTILRPSGEPEEDDDHDVVMTREQIKQMDDERLLQATKVFQVGPDEQGEQGEDEEFSTGFPRQSYWTSLGIGMMIAILFTMAAVLIVMLAQKRFFADLEVDVGWNDPVAAFTLRQVLGINTSADVLPATSHFFVDWQKERMRIDFHGNTESYHAWMVDGCTQYKVDLFNNGGTSCETLVEPHCTPTNSTITIKKTMVTSMEVSWDDQLQQMLERVTWALPQGQVVFLIRDAETDRPYQVGVVSSSSYVNTTTWYDVLDYQKFDPDAPEIDNMFDSVVQICTQHQQENTSSSIPMEWLNTALNFPCSRAQADVVMSLATQISTWQSCTFPFLLPGDKKYEEESGLEEICLLISRDRHRRIFEGIPIGSCYFHNLLRTDAHAAFNVSSVICKSLACSRMIPVIQLYLDCWPCDVLIAQERIGVALGLDVFLPLLMQDNRFNMVAFTPGWRLDIVSKLDTVSNATNSIVL